MGWQTIGWGLYFNWTLCYSGFVGLYLLWAGMVSQTQGEEEMNDISAGL